MIDLGLVDAVDAEAIGEPGARTFRVRARSGTTYAALWLEKEPLAALGRGISQLLAERSSRRAAPMPRPMVMGAFVEHPDIDLHVARLGIDFDPERERLMLVADDAEGLERGDTPTFRMEMTHAQALGLSREVAEVVAAGRPRCPMCGRPLDPVGHFCPGSDGQSFELPIPGPNDQPA